MSLALQQVNLLIFFNVMFSTAFIFPKITFEYQ